MYTQNQNTYQQPRQSYQQPQQQPEPPSPEPTPHNFLETSQFCQQMGLPAEAVGRWIWVTFDEKPDKEIIQSLRDFGFHWSHRRQAWAHDCGHKSYPSQGNPWEKYDSYPLTETAEERRRNFYASDGRRQRA